MNNQDRLFCFLLGGGSGCGTVGRARPSDTRGTELRSGHWQIVIEQNYLLVTVEQT